MKKRKSPRHAFRFKIDNGDGPAQTLVAWANVKQATRAVTLKLTADDVRRSMGMNGVGNTQCCAMALCAKRQSAAFPHKVEGYIDWQYARAYVVTKRDKVTGLPSECVVYRHYDNIAKVNDSRGGQQKLLSHLEKHGDRMIYLSPPEKRKKQGAGAPAGRPTGKRSSRVVAIPAVGAKLRFAMAKAGGVPE